MAQCDICKGTLGKYGRVPWAYFLYVGENIEQRKANSGGSICRVCLMKQQGVKKLYHVSKGGGYVKEFVTRIPKNRVYGEDAETPRICLSSSIAGALSAVEWGGFQLEEIEEEVITVYEVNAEDIRVENILTAEELYITDKVRDAGITGEYWVVNQTLSASKVYGITIDYFEETVWDNIGYAELVECIRGNKELEESVSGCFCKIEQLKYSICGGKV